MWEMKRPDYYRVLGVPPGASERDIRQAYRLLSKQYHPDISPLAPEEALEKFKLLNEAYATLSHPTKRSHYDQTLGLTRTAVLQQQQQQQRPVPPRRRPSGRFDISERPLSPTEIFALFILGIAFAASLLLVAFIDWING
jgi:curved DNA-binding protein CbpA